MSEIQFTIGMTKDLMVARCVAVPLGATLTIPAREGEPVPAAPGFIRQAEVALVTKGAFSVTSERLGELTYGAGELMSAARYPEAHTLACAIEGSAYVCITPRDGTFWEREMLFLGAGDEAIIENGLAFVATGSLTSEGRHAGSVVRLDSPTTLIAELPSYIIHLWKP